MLATASLITKLSKRERFFFNKHCSGSERKSFYILYKFLESKPNIEFKALKTHFANTPIGNNLSVELNLLQKRILRSLHIFRLNNKSIEYTMLKNISYARILYEKKELKNAAKLITQTKKLGYKYEEFVFLTHLIILEEQLGYDSINASIHKILKKLRQERERLNQILNELNTLRKLRTRIIELQYTEGNYVHNTALYPEIFKSDYITLDDYQNSIKGKDHFYLFKSIAFSLIGQTEKSLKYNKLKYENVKNNQHIFTPVDELKSMQNIIYHFILLNDKINFNKEFEVFESYKNRPGIPENLFSYFTAYLQLRFGIAILNLEALNTYIPFAINILNTMKFNLTQTNLLHHNLIGALIMIKDFDKAQDYLISWDKIKKINHAENAVKIARLIVYKELNKIALLKSEYRSFKKTVKIKNKLSELILEYFNSHITGKNKMSGKELHKKLIILFKEENLKKYYNEFYFLSWAKSIS